MSTNADLKAMQEQLAKGNPANVPQPTKAERSRIPMTAPQRRLEVGTLPGYHLQWIRGTPDRIAQAVNAGFLHVRRGEIDVNATGLGSEPLDAGGTDLGENISIIDSAGDVTTGGQPICMYLMKQPQEYHDEDTAIIQSRNDQVVDALTAGLTGAGQGSENSDDVATRFVDRERTKIPEFFRRKSTKR